MPDIKWIKVSTDIWNNKKIKQIESLKNGDAYVVIWMKLLTLAGTINDNGYIYVTPDIPFTDKGLSVELNKPVKIVNEAIELFEDYGMIDIEDGYIVLTGWEKYQSVEGLDKIREQTRNRMKNYRARKREGVTSVGQICVYCGKPANTVDHIIPKIKGGLDKAWNLVPCCKSCNSSKSTKDLADFLNDSSAIDHDLVRNNEKLMRFVKWDENIMRYVTVTSSYEAEEDIDIDKEIDIKRECKRENTLSLPPTIDDIYEFLPRAKEILQEKGMDLSFSIEEIEPFFARNTMFGWKNINNEESLAMAMWIWMTRADDYRLDKEMAR